MPLAFFYSASYFFPFITKNVREKLFSIVCNACGIFWYFCSFLSSFFGRSNAFGDYDDTIRPVGFAAADDAT